MVVVRPGEVAGPHLGVAEPTDGDAQCVQRAPLVFGAFQPLEDRAGTWPVSQSSAAALVPITAQRENPEASVPASGAAMAMDPAATERLGDEALAHERAVRVGGVDQVDAALYGTPEDGDRFVVVRRRAPDAGPRDPHRAEPEAVHRQVAAESEGSNDIVRTGIKHGSSFVSVRSRAGSRIRQAMTRR